MTARYGLSDDARMLVFVAEVAVWRKSRMSKIQSHWIYAIISTIMAARWIYVAHPNFFSRWRSLRPLIMSVLQVMPAQETDEMCQYFQKHAVVSRKQIIFRNRFHQSSFSTYAPRKISFFSWSSAKSCFTIRPTVYQKKFEQRYCWPDLDGE